MKWITLVLQLISLRRSFMDTRSLAEAAGELAARGRMLAVSAGVLGVAALFFFSGILLAIVELGLQLDRGTGVVYSGLMFSSTLLFAIALLCALAGWLLARSGSTPKPPPPPDPRAERIKELLEDFVISFLSQLKTKKPGD